MLNDNTWVLDLYERQKERLEVIRDFLESIEGGRMRVQALRQNEWTDTTMPVVEAAQREVGALEAELWLTELKLRTLKGVQRCR